MAEDRTIEGNIGGTAVDSTTLCDRLIDERWTGLGLAWVHSNLMGALVRDIPAPVVAPVIAPAAPSLPEPKVEALPTPEELKVKLMSLVKNESWVRDFKLKYTTRRRLDILGWYWCNSRVMYINMAESENQHLPEMLSTAVHEFAHHVVNCAIKARYRQSCQTNRAWTKGDPFRGPYRAHSSVFYQWNGVLRERARVLGWEVLVYDY